MSTTSADASDDDEYYYVPNSDEEVYAHRQYQSKMSHKSNSNEKRMHRTHAHLDEVLVDDFSTKFQLKSNEENLNDICTEFNSEQKRLILKQLKDLGNKIQGCSFFCKLKAFEFFF